MQTDTNYEKDFYKWAFEQAALLRAGKLNEADIENIAEEIESMGRSEKRELVSRLTVLLMHLLKWDFQPAKRSKSWKSTINVQRLKLTSHLKDNPSLKSRLDEAMTEAYVVAVAEAEEETGLDANSFPQICPYSFEEVLDKKLSILD